VYDEWGNILLKQSPENFRGIYNLYLIFRDSQIVVEWPTNGDNSDFPFVSRFSEFQSNRVRSRTGCETVIEDEDMGKTQKIFRNIYYDALFSIYDTILPLSDILLCTEDVVRGTDFFRIDFAFLLYFALLAQCKVSAGLINLLFYDKLKFVINQLSHETYNIEHGTILNCRNHATCYMLHATWITWVKSAQSAEEIPAVETSEAIPTLQPGELLASIYNQKKSTALAKKSVSVASKLLPRPNKKYPRSRGFFYFKS